MNNLIQIQIDTYSYYALFEYVEKNNLKIFDLLQVDEYTYSFYCDYKTYLLIKKEYKSCKIINKNSVRIFFLKLISNKLVIICLIISSIFYFYLSKLIMHIEVSGTSYEINEILKLELKEYNIKKYAIIPETSRLKEIEKEIYYKYSDSLDLFNIVKNGNYIQIKYEKKKNRLTLENKKDKIFAKKDAIISKILISSGLVIVKENQFVKQGDLLVDDSISQGESTLYLGTKGYIYGYTYNKIEINYLNLDYDEIFVYARYEISKNFILEENIIEETIIYDNENEKKMIIHYKCEEILNSY